MAIKTKSELKDVFSGLSSIYIKQDGITDFSTVAFDWDLPVTVDSLSISVGEPTINRTKVHGLQADWAVTSTPGDFAFSATVPSIHKDLVKWFLGEANDISTATINTETGWKGFSATLKNIKIYMGIGLLSEDENKLVLVKNMAVYATPLFENASTTPFGFKLTGTIEASDSDDDDNIAFLEKTASDEGSV